MAVGKAILGFAGKAAKFGFGKPDPVMQSLHQRISSRGSRLYHATRTDRATSILKQGINPQAAAASDFMGISRYISTSRIPGMSFLASQPERSAVTFVINKEKVAKTWGRSVRRKTATGTQRNIYEIAERLNPKSMKAFEYETRLSKRVEMSDVEELIVNQKVFSHLPANQSFGLLQEAKKRRIPVRFINGQDKIRTSTLSLDREHLAALRMRKQQRVLRRANDEKIRRALDEARARLNASRAKPQKTDTPLVGMHPHAPRGSRRTPSGGNG